MNKQDKEYVKSERWKCVKSPTGAHVWVEMQDEIRLTPKFRCRFCHEVKSFPAEKLFSKRLPKKGWQ